MLVDARDLVLRVQEGQLRLNAAAPTSPYSRLPTRRAPRKVRFSLSLPALPPTPMLRGSEGLRQDLEWCPSPTSTRARRSPHARDRRWHSRIEREQAGDLENKLPTFFACRYRPEISARRQRTNGTTRAPAHLYTEISLPQRLPLSRTPSVLDVRALNQRVNCYSSCVNVPRRETVDDVAISASARRGIHGHVTSISTEL